MHEHYEIMIFISSLKTMPKAKKPGVTVNNNNINIIDTTINL